MLNHLFAVLALASGLAHPLAVPAAPPATALAAASAPLDPTAYLLDESELPEGFPHDPSEDLSAVCSALKARVAKALKSGEGWEGLATGGYDVECVENEGDYVKLLDAYAEAAE